MLPAYDGDAIFEWEELVPVTKSAILTDLGTPTEDDEPEDDAESEEEAEDEEEDECDGSCLACTIMRLIAAAANIRDPEEAAE